MRVRVSQSFDETAGLEPLSFRGGFGEEAVQPDAPAWEEMHFSSLTPFLKEGGFSGPFFKDAGG